MNIELAHGIGHPERVSSARYGRLRTKFIAFDDALAKHGVPPLTQWWRDGIGEWLDAYEREGVLELWCAVGRGAAKSTALAKLATFFTLFGDFTIPPGERHYACVLSRLKEEAAKGIAIISRWLTILGVRHRPAGDVIDLEDDPSRGIRVIGASVAAASGWRAFFVGKDERSKWPQGGSDDLDASEIDTSAGAMTATHPNAPMIALGSAWGAFGTFYEAITSGSDATKRVLGPTPTWIAAPHIREEDTRRKERDPKKWAREYACEFQSGGIGALDVEALKASIRDLLPDSAWLHGQEIVIDSQGGKNDNFIIARFGYVLEQGDEPEFLMADLHDTQGNVIAPRVTPLRDGDGRRVPNPKYQPPTPRLFLADMVSYTGEETRRLLTHDIADRIETIARRNGIVRVHGDQYGAWSWSSDLAKRSLVFEEHPWTAPAKSEAVLRLRQLIREGTLVINPAIGAEATEIVREATTFEERISPSGILTFGARGTSKDDRIMTLLLAARVDVEGRLQGSPLATRGAKHVIYDNDEDNLAEDYDD